jgi:hypothetical protein
VNWINHKILSNFQRSRLRNLEESLHLCLQIHNKYFNTFSCSTFRHWTNILFWKIDFRTKSYFLNFLTKLHLNLKIFVHVIQSLMFCVNILFCNTSFDSRSSFARNVALTVIILSSTKIQGSFLAFITYTKSKKRKFLNTCSKTL